MRSKKDDVSYIWSLIPCPEAILTIRSEIMPKAPLLILPNPVHVLRRHFPRQTQVLIGKNEIILGGRRVEENCARRPSNHFQGEERTIRKLNIVEWVCVPAGCGLDLNWNFPAWRATAYLYV